MKSDKLPFDLTLALWTVRAAFVAAFYRSIVGHDTITYIGSYNFTTQEPVLFLALITCSFLAMKRPLRTAGGSLILLSLSGITALSFVRGLFFNAYDSIVSLRAIGVFTCFLFMSCYLPASELLWRRIARFIVTIGFFTAGLLYIRLIVGVDFLIQIDFVDINEINDGGRALSAEGALIIGMSATLLLSKLMRMSSPSLTEISKFSFLLAALVLSHQGSATLASIGAFGIVFGFSAGPSQSLRTSLAAGTGLLLIIALFVLPSLVDAETIQSILPESITGDLEKRFNNLGGRQYIWSGLLNDIPRWPLIDQLLGLPSGKHPVIILPIWGGVEWEASLHSTYFGFIASVGFVGLTLYILLLTGLVFRSCTALLRFRASADFDVILTLAFAIMCSIYGYGYELRAEEGVLIMWAAKARSSRKSAISEERGSITEKYKKSYLSGGLFQ